MYLKNDISRYQTSYLAALEELRESWAVYEVSGCIEPAIAAIDRYIAAGSLYKALKEIRKLIKREEELRMVAA